MGVQLLWPFRAPLVGLEPGHDFDLWILVLLGLGLLLPLLLRMVNEEVGARKRGRGSSAAGIVTLVLVAGYLGWLANLHARAVDMLLANEYHGRVALSAGAFPESSAPFDWYGVIVTDDTMEEVEVPLGPGQEFDPHMSETHFKPGESPALAAAEKRTQRLGSSPTPASRSRSSARLKATIASKSTTCVSRPTTKSPPTSSSALTSAAKCKSAAKVRFASSPYP